MIKATVDDAVIDELMAKFDAMADGLAQLDHTLPEELTKWQREDLHRVRTFTDTPATLVATTKVWRRWRKHKQPGRRRYRRRRRGASTQIVSPKLISELHTRMYGLVVNSIASAP